MQTGQLHTCRRSLCATVEMPNEQKQAAETREESCRDDQRGKKTRQSQRWSSYSTCKLAKYTPVEGAYVPQLRCQMNKNKLLKPGKRLVEMIREARKQGRVKEGQVIVCADWPNTHL